MPRYFRYFCNLAFFNRTSFLTSLRYVLLLWLWCVSLQIATAQSPSPSVSVIYPQIRHSSLVASTEYLRDPSRHLSLSDILQPTYSRAFRQTTSESLVFGWTRDAVWLRTSLRAANKAEALSWVLDVGFMSLDSVSLFVPVSGGSANGAGGVAWRELRSGGSVPFAMRDERYARVMFPLTLPSQDSVLTVYVRIVATNSMYLNMFLTERRTLENSLEEHNLIILLLLGVMVSALLYNAVMFVSMRDKLYGYYIFYTASVICSYTTIHGLVIKHFVPVLVPYIGSIISVSFFLTYIGALLFGKEFLLTSRFAPRFERFMVYSAWCLGLCILLVLAMPSVGWIIPIATASANGVLLVAAFLSARKGYRQAWFYLAAWSMFLCGATYFGSVSSGLIVADTTPVFAVLTASTAFELTMFSFVLAYRFRHLRDDIRAAERERQFAEQQREWEHRQNLELLAEKNKTEDLNAQLRASNSEKSEILGVVAHDLQNPLTSIMLSGEILTDLVAKRHYDSVPRVVDNINVVAVQMLEIVRNLLNVNLLESGVLTLRQETFDIAPILHRAIEQYAPAARAKNITLQLRAEEAHTMVLADSQAVARVLDNLLSNAIKYSPQKKNVYVRLQAAQNAVRVEVQDEGAGISPEDMKKLFVKFARLSAVPTGGEHSTGLGLSIVKKMVEAMNGRVWCESGVGDGLSSGATFIVELPAAATAGATA